MIFFSAAPVMMSLISYLSLNTWFHIMLTHISPHSIEPQCCFYLSYCLSETLFSVVLYCRQTPLICFLILYAFPDANTVENLGVFSSTSLNFISELGRRNCVHTGDAKETSYLFQRISIMLQRFNSVLLHDTLPVDLPDL